MFFQIGNEKIVLDFNKGITVKCNGPEIMYYVECLEYRGIDNLPYLVEGFHFSHHDFWKYKEFHLPIEFYMDFEIVLYKLDDEFGLKRIFSHRFNENDQLVKFVIDTNDFEEARIWVDKILDYKIKKSCHIEIHSKFDEINNISDTRYKAKNLTPYKTYRIGRYSKDSQDWKTIDPRKENLIWFGNWKTFWSYQHPRLWKNLTSEEIVNDILGL
jgi:hypothetical protein